MNNLAKITDAVHRWGEYGAIYVGDYNNEFANHRYCEPGVKEPQPDRDETWFFESHTPGDGQISPSARDFGKPGKGENSAFGQQLLKHVLPNFKSVDDIKKAARAGKLPANARPDIKNSRDEWDALFKAAESMSDDINIRSDWFVGLIRVSHPQAPGLGAMVDQIFSAFPK